MDFNTVLETEPYTYEIAAQIIAKIKNDLIECGCGIPVFLFHGMRANGKTSTIKACMENLDNVVKFSDGYKEIKKKISKMNPNEVLLVDNYPQYISSAGHQQGKRILEYIVDQGSENPDFPLVAISAENYIYDDLVDSIKTRMLEIEVPKIEADPLLARMRQYLIENRGDYLNRILEFMGWYKYDKDNMKRELDVFRSKYSGHECRVTGIAFSYYYACKIYSCFNHHQYGRGLNMHMIESCCEGLLNNKNPKAKISTIASVMNYIIEDNSIFHVMEPAYGCYCSQFLKGACKNFNNRCKHYMDCSDCGNHYSCNCENSDEETLNGYYNPMHLRLDTTENAAVLIGRPSRIYQFPDYIDYDGPILIVSSDDLLRVVNIELNAYCIENGLELPSYGPKQLSKELFENNLCLYHYHTKEHKTYTFDYSDRDNQNRKVILLRISKEQYKLLHNRAKNIDRAFLPSIEFAYNNFDGHEYNSFIRALKQLGKNVHVIYRK